MRGLIALSWILLLVAILYGIQSARQPSWVAPGPSASQTPTNGQTPMAQPTRREVKPRLNEAERRSATEALQALKALQSVTTAGLTYREYSPRVLDAKIQVDRYVQSDGGEPALKRSVQDAMTLYVFASQAWNTKITKRWTDIVDDPRIDLCPLAKRFKEEAREHQYVSRTTDAGIRISNSMALLWGCASDKIDEIERTLKER